jgi:hypothetical protein
MDREPRLRDTRTFTYMATFFSLTIGVLVAVVVGLFLLSLRQPISTDSSGSVTWSIGAFMIPLAGLLSAVILAWSVFGLPIRFAHRWNIDLDTQVWPATGVITLGLVVIVAFVGAIVLGII